MVWSWRMRREDSLAAPGGSTNAQDLVAAVLAAWHECDQARNYFNTVTDAELIDEAVLRLAAAERRYAYLLRQARTAGLCSAPPCAR